MLIAVTVVPHGRLVQRLLDDLDGYAATGCSGRFACHLQRGQRPARITGGELHQEVDGLVGDLDRTTQTPRVGDRAT